MWAFVTQTNATYSIFDAVQSRIHTSSHYEPIIFKLFLSRAVHRNPLVKPTNRSMEAHKIMHHVPFVDLTPDNREVEATPRANGHQSRGIHPADGAKHYPLKPVHRNGWKSGLVVNNASLRLFRYRHHDGLCGIYASCSTQSKRMNGNHVNAIVSCRRYDLAGLKPQWACIQIEALLRDVLIEIGSVIVFALSDYHVA